jgi:hypothetical protein
MKRLLLLLLMATPLLAQSGIGGGSGLVITTAEIIGSCDDGTLHTTTRTAPAISGVANIIINLAATTATQAGDFTFKGWTIEYLGGA